MHDSNHITSAAACRLGGDESPIHPSTRSRKSHERAMPNAETLLFSSSQQLLSSERLADFQALLDAIKREVKPSGIIEEIYVNDIAWFVWEILRLRRCRIPIIKASYPDALRELLANVTKKPMEFEINAEDRGLELAENWFASERGKDEVRKILKQFDLDESTIEAVAIRRSARDLEKVDKLLMALEARRDEALASLADYRSSLVRQRRKNSDRLLEAEATDVPRLVDASVQTSPE